MIGRFEAFTFLISDLTRNIRRIKTGEMVKWNLKSRHVSCIYYLFEHGPLTVKELCEVCGDDKANLSRSIEYLEENGYLKVKEIGSRGYKKHYELTESGYAVGRDIFSRIEQIISKASEGLSDGDRDIMYRSLGMINDNLKKITDEY